MNNRILLPTFLLLVFAFQKIYAQSGQLDQSFGQNGTARYGISPLPQNNDYARCMTIQQDGKIVAAANSETGGNFYISVIRLNEDGSLDNSFTNDQANTGKLKILVGPDTTIIVSQIKLDAQEKIVLAGIARIANKNNFLVIRLNTDGTMDQTFGINGKVIVSLTTGNDQANNLAIDQSGKIWVTGIANNSDNVQSDYGLVRLMPDGTLDDSFDNDGKIVIAVTSFNESPEDILFDAQGRLLISGASNDANFKWQGSVIRILPDGTLDNSFDGDGKLNISIPDVPETFARNISLDNQGRILVAGTKPIGISGKVFLGRYQEDGSVDNLFNSIGYSASSPFEILNTDVSALLIQADQKIVLLGTQNFNRGVISYRFDPSGNKDLSYNGTGSKFLQNTMYNSYGTSNCSDGILDDMGKLVFVGEDAISENRKGYYFGRINTNGSLDNSFSKTGELRVALGKQPDIVTSSLLYGNNLVVAGYSTIATNAGAEIDDDFSLLKLDANGILDYTFGNEGKLIIPFGPGLDHARCMAKDNNGEIIIGGYTANAGNADFAVAKLTETGSLVSAFGTYGKAVIPIAPANGYDSVNAIAIDNQNRIILAGNSANGTQMAMSVIRLLPNGQLDNSFGTGGKLYETSGDYQNVSSVQVEQNGKIIIGATSNRNGAAGTDFLFVRLNEDGSIDQSFTGDGVQIVSTGSADLNLNALKIDSDNKYVAAGFSGNSGSKDFTVVRINQDGSPDLGFDGDGIAIIPVGTQDDEAYALEQLPGGKIMVSGNSHDPAGQIQQYSVIRLNANGSLDNSFGNNGKSILASSFAQFGRSMVVKPTGNTLLAGFGSLPTSSAEFVVMQVKSEPLQSYPYFRSLQSGNWSNLSSWEFSADSITWELASRYPDFSDTSIAIWNGHEITIDIENLTIDDVLVESGGMLTSIVNRFYVSELEGEEIPAQQGIGIQVNGTLNINASQATLSKTISVAGIANILQGGTYGNALIIETTGSLNLTSSNNKGIFNLKNNGQVNWMGGNLNFASAPTNTGTFSDFSNNKLTSINGFNNTGIYRKVQDTTVFQIIDIGGNFSGAGVLQFSGGRNVFFSSLSPGDDIGALEIIHDRPMKSYEFDFQMLNTDGAGIGHDLLLTNGSIELTGILKVTEFNSLPNGNYTIIRRLAGSLIGTFTSVQLPDSYSVAYFPDSVVLVKNILPPGFFRTTKSGNWTDLKGWEYSPDSLVWSPATRKPNATDTTILIRNGHDVVLNAISLSVDDIIVEEQGILTIDNSYITIPKSVKITPAIIINGTLNIDNGSITNLTSQRKIIIHGICNFSSGSLTQYTTTTNRGQTIKTNTFRGIEISPTGVLNLITAGSKQIDMPYNYGTVNWFEGTLVFGQNPSGNNNVYNYGIWNDKATGTMSGKKLVFSNTGTYFKQGGATQLTPSDSKMSYLAVQGGGLGLFKGFGSIDLGTSPGLNRISPGDSIGSLSFKFAGSLFVNVLDIELGNDEGPGIGHDILETDGSLSLGTTLNVTELANLAFGSYTIVRNINGGITGTFGITNLPKYYRVDYYPDSVVLVKDLANQLPANYFRSVLSGTWTDPANWEYSADSLVWVAASRFPDFNDTYIVIRDGHEISIDEDNLTIDGVLVETGGILTTNNVSNLQVRNPVIYPVNENGEEYLLTGIQVNGTLNIIGRIDPFQIISIAGIGNMYSSQTGSAGVSGNFGLLLIENSGILNIMADNNGFDRLTNNGIVNWRSGSLYFPGTPTNNGIFNDSATNSLQSINGFNNQGIYRKVSGTTTFSEFNSISGILTGSGVMNFTNSNEPFFTILRPGDSIGTLQLIHNRLIKANVYEFQLKDNSGAGSGHDLLVVNGDLDINGTLKVTEYSNLPGGNYTIIRKPSGSFIGNFSVTQLPPYYTVQYYPDSIVLVKTPPVPRNISIVNPAAIAEGNSGQKELKFAVRLNAASTGQVKVNYTTQDSTATAGEDYTTISGTLVINAGILTDTIRVPILGDKLVESVEKLKVVLSNPVNGIITTAIGVGTINNDDAFPAIALTNSNIPEGTNRDSTLLVKVRLTSSYPLAVSVNYFTQDSTTTVNEDYFAANGTLTFQPGDTLAFIPVTIRGDRLDEPNEIINIVYSTPQNATLATTRSRVSITDDDVLPAVAFTNMTITEGNNDLFNTVTVTARLTKAYPLPVSVTYALVDSTATNGSDYQAVSGVLNFAPEDTLENISFTISGDRIVEPNEIIKLLFTAPVNATAPTAASRIIIGNDDSYPAISITTSATPEGDVSTTDAVLTVRLSKRYPQNVTVQLATADITAIAGIDYTAQIIPLTFLADGDTLQSVVVKVLPDLIDEANETFKAQLSSPTNATIPGTGAVNVTITDNDPVPAIRVYDSTAIENSGTMVMRVALMAASGRPVKVAWRTQDGTALNSSDYTRIITDTVFFNPGETVKYINIPVLTDALVEGNETFSVILSSPTNGTVAAAQGGDNTGVATLLNSTTVAGRISNGSLPVDQTIVTSINKLQVKVLPNPSANLFSITITSNGEGLIHLKVVDLGGRVIEERKAEGKTQQLQLGGGWTTGTYFLQVFHGNERKTVQLIKL